MNSYDFLGMDTATNAAATSATIASSSLSSFNQQQQPKIPHQHITVIIPLNPLASSSDQRGRSSSIFNVKSFFKYI
jgi:hypothetical protein